MENNITVNNSWFKSWFDTSFYHQLYGNHDENEAKGFVEQLVAELQPALYSKMLDLGCGSGRHSKWLADNGFDVTGLDLSASSIRSAKKYQNYALRFYRHDMRVPFGNNYFDYVFNFFTSFGYFKTRHEDHQVVHNISSALKLNGTLVMDYISVDFAEKRFVAEETKEIDGIIYNISRSMDEEHFFKKISIEDAQADGPFEFTEQVKKFRLTDFENLFSQHGLEIREVYGDYLLNDYDAKTSPRLIMIVKKISDENRNR